jgi:hypothetical protein
MSLPPPKPAPLPLTWTDRIAVFAILAAIATFWIMVAAWWLS